MKYFIGGSVSWKQAPRARTRDVKDKAKFGEVHRSAAKKGTSERSGEKKNGQWSPQRNGGNICLGSGGAALRTHRNGVSSFTGRSARSRCDAVKLVPPWCVHAWVFIIFVLSSLDDTDSPPPPRAFLFPRDLFWSTGKHLRQLRGGGPPGLHFSYEAGAHLPRFSLAYQLRVPLSASPTPLTASLHPPPLRAAVAFRPPSRYHHGFSLTFSRYRPSCTPIFSSPSPPSSPITWLRSLSSCFALVPTSCISSSVSIYTSTFVINYWAWEVIKYIILRWIYIFANIR